MTSPACRGRSASTSLSPPCSSSSTRHLLITVTQRIFSACATVLSGPSAAVGQDLACPSAPSERSSKMTAHHVHAPCELVIHINHDLLPAGMRAASIWCASSPCPAASLAHALAFSVTRRLDESNSTLRRQRPRWRPAAEVRGRQVRNGGAAHRIRWK